jgi:hypothetical protein
MPIPFSSLQYIVFHIFSNKMWKTQFPIFLDIVRLSASLIVAAKLWITSI